MNRSIGLNFIMDRSNNEYIFYGQVIHRGVLSMERIININRDGSYSNVCDFTRSGEDSKLCGFYIRDRIPQYSSITEYRSFNVDILGRNSKKNYKIERDWTYIKDGALYFYI